MCGNQTTGGAPPQHDEKVLSGESEADYLELLLQKGVGNTLLFQSHIFSKPIRNQIIKQRLLIRLQPGKSGAIWSQLLHPSGRCAISVSRFIKRERAFGNPPLTRSSMAKPWVSMSPQ